MQEQQAVVVAVNRLDRIAATLLIVRDVELELDVAGIGRVQDSIHIVGPLAEAVHVIVIAERDADVGRAFADLREHAAQALPVIGGGRAVFWLLVGDLQVIPHRRAI